MRALVLHDWVKSWGGNLKLEERPLPQPAEGEVLVKVRACGVGLTVSHFLKGEASRDPSLLPRVPGHEIAGEVEDLGPGVMNLKEGDKVLAYFYLVCDHCRACLAGRQNLCINFRGQVGRNIDGGYAEYVKLPARNLLPMPSDLGFEEATVINDAVATPVHVANRSCIVQGEDVLVVGAGGGVGIHMVQVAKAYGARVIAVDLGEEKLSMAKRVGADEVIDAKEEDVAERVKEITQGQGVGVAIDFVGLRETLQACLEVLARGGRLVNMVTSRSTRLELDPARLVRGEFSFMGSRYATKAEFLKAAEMVSKGLVKPVISKRSGLEGVEDIHALLDEGKVIGRGVLIP